MVASLAVSFEILDLVSGNTVAAFRDEMKAHEALAELASAQPGARDRLALVMFDAEGIAITSRLANEPIHA